MHKRNDSRFKFQFAWLMWMRLEDICTVFTDGDWIESKDQADEGIRLIQTGNIGMGAYLEKEEKAKYISEETFNKLKCTEIFSGDILVSRLPEPVGRACIIPEKKERMITAVDCTICRSNEAIVCKEYLCYFMRSNAYYTRLLNSVTGTTRKRISRKNLGNVELDIPSKREQEKVVKQLDCLVKVISSRITELQRLDDLIKARFVEMFGDPIMNQKGWRVKTLGELSVQINSGNTPKGGEQVYTKKGITFFRSQNVWKDRLEMKDIAYIDEKTHASMKKSSLKHGDILMTKTGRINTVNSSLGRAALYLGEDDAANVNGHVYFIRLKPNVNNKFVLRILVSNEYRDYIRSVCVGGIDKRQLNKNHIEDFPIICPPKDMVDEYIDFVNQVHKSKVEIQQALEKTQLLFDSLMQQYFG